MNMTKRPVAANDNVRAITMPNDGPTPEWLAERNAAGTATTYRYQTPRIEKALVKEGSPHVITLRRISELMRPANTATTVDIENADERDDAPNTGYGTERKHNQASFLPSVPMLLRAYEAGMQTGVRDLQGAWHRIGPWDGKGKLTGLIFYKGELVAYGDDAGRRRTPKYVADPVGLSFNKDDTDKAYLNLPATAPYRPATNADAPRSLCPPTRTHRAAKAAALLEGAANDNVKVTYCPDGIAAEYGRTAGISEPTGIGDGGTSAPRHPAFDEMDRADAYADLNMGHADLDVIESIFDDESFRTIGLKFGAADSSAHKTGRRIVERTLQKISEKLAT